MAKPSAISGCTIIDVAPNHATLPQKTDRINPMVNTGRATDIVRGWDCSGLPSRRKENEAIVVHFDDQTGGQEVVQRFVGLIVTDV